jgi:hypothetical protein
MAPGHVGDHHPGMDPLVTGDSIDVSPLHVITVVLIAIVIGLLGVGLRRLLMAVADELAELWRSYAPIASQMALDHRPGMPETPWFCVRCRSRNSASSRRCYSCDARREEAEAPVPDAEVPGGASAGLSARTRRHG